MKPYTEKEMQTTIKAIVTACKDISKLKDKAYKYIILMSGFIAHYDIEGFKITYENRDLKQEIIESITRYNY